MNGPDRRNIRLLAALAILLALFALPARAIDPGICECACGGNPAPGWICEPCCDYVPDDDRQAFEPVVEYVIVHPLDPAVVVLVDLLALVKR